MLVISIIMIRLLLGYVVFWSFALDRNNLIDLKTFRKKRLCGVSRGQGIGPRALHCFASLAMNNLNNALAQEDALILVDYLPIQCMIFAIQSENNCFLVCMSIVRIYIYRGYRREKRVFYVAIAKKTLSSGRYIWISVATIGLIVRRQQFLAGSFCTGYEV